MTPDYQRDGITLYRGDCREVATSIEGVTAIVTDPPYGLTFMGKGWDKGIPDAGFWRVLASCCLPGSMMLAFGGTRTHHRLICAIEDAGWEIRDCLMWLYGSGFPKSHDISKAIDKAAGKTRDITGNTATTSGRTVGAGTSAGFHGGIVSGHCRDITAPATDLAETWDGYGTALKPAWEPICLAMKPLDGTFAQNAETHGVAGLNIDGSRVGIDGEQPPTGSGNRRNGNTYAQDDYTQNRMCNGGNITPPAGRWPANVIHGGSEEVVEGVPKTKGEKARLLHGQARNGVTSFKMKTGSAVPDNGGSAARFFYCAKASKAERNAGCGKPGTTESGDRQAYNHHPTVKPLALLRYLVGLVTMPEQNLIFDPFMGSGTTGVACASLGLPFVGVELLPEYFDIAAKRIDHELDQQKERQPLFA